MAIHIRTVAKRSWIITLRVIALLMIIISIALGLLLGTEAGRVSLAHHVTSLYGLYAGIDVRLSGIRSRSIGDWQVQSAVWSPKENAMEARLQQLDVSWNWRYALKNRWWLPSVSIGRLELTLVDSTKSDKNIVRDYSTLWQRIPSMRLEQLQIDNLIINRPRYPSLSLAVTARADINWDVIPARFILSVLDNESSSELAMQLSSEGLDQFRFKGGMIATAQKKWAQWLKWELDQDINANWNVFVDYSTPNQLNINVADSSLPWGDHQLTMLGKVDYLIEEQQFNFDHLAMQLNGQPASINGWINRKESDLDIDVGQWTLAPVLKYYQIDSASGSVDGSLRWYGGWRTPRINGQVVVSGLWQGVPVLATIKSDATSSGLTLDQAQVTVGKNSLNVLGEIDWRSDQLNLFYDTSLKRGDFFNALIDGLPASLDFTSLLEGQIEGSIKEPTVNYASKTQLTYLNEPYQASIEGTVSRENIIVQNYTLYGQKAHLTGGAEFSLNDNQWRTNLNVIGLDSKVLDFLSIQLPIDWQATLSGGFQIEKSNNDFNLFGRANLLGSYEQQPLNAQLNIVDMNKGSIELGDSTIRIGSSFVQGAGRANWLDPGWDFKLSHTDFSVDLIQPWISQWPELLASLNLNLTGETVLSNVWSAPIIATNSSFQGDWFGKPLTGKLETQPESLNNWQLSLTEFSWFDGMFTYQGALDAFNLDIDGAVGIANWSLDDFVQFNQRVLGRTLQTPGSLTGDMNAQLIVDGSVDDYLVSGDLHFLGSYEQQLITANAQIVSLTPQAVAFSALNAQWSDNSAALNGRYNWSNGQYLINLNADVSNVEPLVELVAPFILEPTTRQSLESWIGSLNASLFAHNDNGIAFIEGGVDSQGQLFNLDYQLAWQGSGSWQDVLSQQLDAQWGEATFNADVELRSQQLAGSIQLSQLSIEQIQKLFPQLPAGLSGQIDSTISVRGSLADPLFELDSNAQGGWKAKDVEHQWQATVDAYWQQKQWTLTTANIAVEGGGQIVVSGQGQGRTGNILLTAEIPQTAYWIQDTELGPGRSSIKLSVTGDLMRPEIELDSSWQAEVWPILLTSKIRTSEESINVSGTLFSDGLNRLKTSLKLPRLSWTQWRTDWQETPFSASLAVHSPLSVLDPFFVDRPNQSVSGLLAGQLQFDGSIIAPQWQGEIEWRDGKFENVTTGTLVSGMDVTLLAQDQAFNLIGLANDGRNGLLEVNGGVQFLPSADDLFNHEFNLNLKAFNANLVNDAQIDATMTGSVSATGRYHNMLLSGAFDVSPLNLQTETFLLDGVPQLNIVQSLDSVEQEELKRPFYWPTGQWDVQFTASNRANLYGQGISTELAGSLQMLGDFSAPTVGGRFNVIRGTYSGLGKVFSVTGGSVQIQNNQLVFNVEASYDEANLNVLLTIAGNQDELTLTLTSEPALDQNELLAQLVFGKSIESISEFQAIQLAYLVNNIRTGTTSFDLIGSTRQELSLDALIIDPQTDEEGNLGVNIRAGKYLNNYLYLEVEQNVGSDEGFRSSLQMQVSPNTYLELFTEEALGNGGAELNWSLDY